MSSTYARPAATSSLLRGWVSSPASRGLFGVEEDVQVEQVDDDPPDEPLAGRALHARRLREALQLEHETALQARQKGQPVSRVGRGLRARRRGRREAQRATGGAEGVAEEGARAQVLTQTIERSNEGRASPWPRWNASDVDGSLAAGRMPGTVRSVYVCARRV